MPRVQSRSPAIDRIVRDGQRRSPRAPLPTLWQHRGVAKLDKLLDPDVAAPLVRAYYKGVELPDGSLFTYSGAKFDTLASTLKSSMAHFGEVDGEFPVPALPSVPPVPR